MDSEFRIDISEIARTIDTTDVVALYFPLLRKTLLIDLRTSQLDGPMAKIVQMVATPAERFSSLSKLRPRFAPPESITIIPWPKFVGSLERLGVWDTIIRRFAEAGSPQSVRDCEACLAQLRDLERKELIKAVTGDGYRNIWDLEDEETPEIEEADDGEEDFL